MSFHPLSKSDRVDLARGLPQAEGVTYWVSRLLGYATLGGLVLGVAILIT